MLCPWHHPDCWNPGLLVHVTSEASVSLRWSLKGESERITRDSGWLSALSYSEADMKYSKEDVRELSALLKCHGPDISNNRGSQRSTAIASHLSVHSYPRCQKSWEKTGREEDRWGVCALHTVNEQFCFVYLTFRNISVVFSAMSFGKRWLF